MSPDLLRAILLIVALGCFVGVFATQRAIARAVARELTGRELGFAGALWASWDHPAAARKGALDRVSAGSPRVRRAQKCLTPLLVIGIAAAFLADLQLER